MHESYQTYMSVARGSFIKTPAPSLVYTVFRQNTGERE